MVYCFDHINGSGILAYSYNNKSRVYTSAKSKPSFAKKIASQSRYNNQNRDSMIAMEFFVFKPHSTKGVGRNQFTRSPNKEFW